MFLSFCASIVDHTQTAEDRAKLHSTKTINTIRSKAGRWSSKCYKFVQLFRCQQRRRGIGNPIRWGWDGLLGRTSRHICKEHRKWIEMHAHYVLTMYTALFLYWHYLIMLLTFERILWYWSTSKGCQRTGIHISGHTQSTRQRMAKAERLTSVSLPLDHRNMSRLHGWTLETTIDTKLSSSSNAKTDGNDGA